MPKSIASVTWNQIHEYCRQIALQVEKDDFQVEYIVAVANGGLVPAAILGKMLDKKVIGSIALTSKEGTGTNDKQISVVAPATVKTLSEEYQDKNILIVDELVDGGDTMLLIQSANWFPNSKTAVLIRKPGTKFDPDFYLPWPEEQKDEWITFPWEIK